MREVSGTTWTFQVIIFFILIFAGFLTLVLNYFKVYSVKNDMLTVIEKYEGITEDSMGIINNILKSKSYKATGKCPTDENWFGVMDLDGSYEKVKSDSRYYYCFQKNNIYYNVKLFYRFNLPFLGDIITFGVDGRSNAFIGSSESI